MSDTPTEVTAMDQKMESGVLAGVCGLLALASLASVGWAAASGLVHDIDGLLLSLTGLLMALLFGVQAFLTAKTGGWLRAAKKSDGEGTAAAAKAEGPAAPAQTPPSDSK
jgi:hypothetical protein